VTKCPVHLSENDENKIINVLSPKQNQQVLFCYNGYGEKLLGNNTSISLDDLRGKKITLVTGIATPKSLVDYLMDKGMDLEHLEFKDHHFFNQQEIDLINSKEHVLTTEKDFSRLRDKVENLNYISVKHVLYCQRYSPLFFDRTLLV